MLTRNTESLAARARMSAQDTMFRHCGSLSTAALALITVPNPSSFSVMPSGLRHSSSPAGLISNTDASQPLIHRSQDWRRSISPLIGRRQ